MSMNMNPYLNVIKAVNFKLYNLNVIKAVNFKLYRLHNDTNERIKLFRGGDMIVIILI